MSGKHVGKSPSTDAEWARDVEQRLGRLETKNTVRVGEWTLTSQNGNLQATKPGIGTLFLDGSGEAVAAVPDNRGTTVSGDDVTKAITGNSGPLENIGTWLDTQWAKFLTDTSELKWSNLKSQLPHWLTPSTLNVGALTSVPINYLADPSFDADLVAPSGRWTRDSTVYRTSGWSTHITANGVEASLHSNVVAISDGQKVTMTIYVAETGLTGSGVLLELTALPFTRANDGTDTMIAGTPISLATLTAAQITGDLSDWFAPPTAGTPRGLSLSGSWVSEGADGMALRITLHTAATAGDVWWDDGDYAFTGTIASSAIANLDDNLLNFTNKWQQLGEIMHGDAVTAWDADIAKLQSWWQSITGTGAAGTVDPGAIQDMTVGTSTGPIAALVQNLIDTLARSRWGAAVSATGNDSSVLLPALSTFPVGQIQPIPPGASSLVTISSSGHGNAGNNGPGPMTLAWGDDTILSTDDYLYAAVNCATTAGKGCSCSVTVGANTYAMIPLAILPGFGSLGGAPVLTVFGLPNPPAGVPTFTATSKENASIESMMEATSLILAGVGSVEDISYENSGTNSNPAQSTAYAVTGSLVVNAQATYANNGNGGNDSTLSAYSPGSALYQSGRVTVGGTFDANLVVGAVTNPASPTFASTMAGKTNHTSWGSISIAFNPAAEAGKGLGSGFRRYRASTTGVSLVSGDNPLGTFFDTADDTTDYLVYDPATGLVTVLYTGGYSISVHVLEKNTLVSHIIRPLVYADGSVIRRGGPVAVTSNAADTYCAAGSWNRVSLKANQKLQAGVWSSKAVSNILIGEVNGVESAFEIALTSRGLL